MKDFQMGRLEFEPVDFLTPERLQKRFNQVTALLCGEGLRLDDLKSQGQTLLGPGTDLKTFIGIIAVEGNLQIEPHYNPDGTFDCDVVRYVEGKKLVSQLKEKIEKRTDQAHLILSRRKLIPEEFRY